MSIVDIQVENLDDINRALGDLAARSPQAAKVAINATAREARKLMIQEVKARYALEEAGLRHVKELKQTRKATNTSLRAELKISTPRNDLAYFQHKPKGVFTGPSVFTSAADVVRARVLKSSHMTDLKGDSGHSKGFLVKFASGHVGMVQRVIGKRSKSSVTARGKPRWASKNGIIEDIQTMGSPSATAMHRVSFDLVEPDIVDYFRNRLDKQVQTVLARYSGRH